jgi:plasmid stabilization system protein ParE
VHVRFEVFISDTAKRDLAEVWDYIAVDDLHAAVRWVGELERRVATLECFPERCPLIAENEFLGTRMRHLVLGDYRVVFRVSGRRVHVVRCIHGARLLEPAEEAE